MCGRGVPHATAMATGERAAAAVEKALSRKGRLDARDLRAYERQANRMFARFRKFVAASDLYTSSRKDSLLPAKAS